MSRSLGNTDSLAHSSQCDSMNLAMSVSVNKKKPLQDVIVMLVVQITLLLLQHHPTNRFNWKPEEILVRVQVFGCWQEGKSFLYIVF